MKALNLLGMLLLISLITICLTSCNDEEDDTQVICESGCTVVKGKVVSSNKQVVSGVGIKVTYEKIGFLYRKSRIKAVNKSDGNGFYEMRFGLKDDELTEEDGFYRFFWLNIDLENLGAEKYILPSDLTSVTENIPTSANTSLRCKKDTIIEKSFFIPQKRCIPVILKGFKPIQSNDRFEIQTFFPWGFEYEGEKMLDTKYGIESSGYDRFIASKEEETFLKIPFALNENNILRTIKMKNGVPTMEDHLIYVTEDSPMSLIYEY